MQGIAGDLLQSLFNTIKRPAGAEAVIRVHPAVEFALSFQLLEQSQRRLVRTSIGNAGDSVLVVVGQQGLHAVVAVAVGRLSRTGVAHLDEFRILANDAGRLAGLRIALDERRTSGGSPIVFVDPRELERE